MPTTRLAAIMFTPGMIGIGYTSMMQRNRDEAMEAVRLYESVLRDRIAHHEGELLQTYGDGSLSIFDSASAAVQCAKEIQEAIRQAIPLRIGLHLGEITMDGDHTFGDGVNIASRVESMGVAGAVLVSSSIRQQIKNKPEFQLESLGKFSFKNVSEPMTVYALANEGFAIPGPDEMWGKGEKVKAGNNHPKSIIRFASVGFVAMVVGAVLFWTLGTDRAGKAQLLEQEIREGKVGVAIFENFTNDPEMDALGYLASEWITSSLREIDIQTVAPEMIRQYKDYVGIFPDNPEGEISFSEITGARYLISGSYFSKGDSIRLNTRLLNAVTGQEIQQFPVFWKNKNEKEALVEEVRQQLMGYWAIEKNQHFPKVRPPKYEAYQKYLTCVGGGLQCYLEALELDSTFLLAHTAAMYSSVWWEKEDFHFRSREYLDRNQEFLTTYEKNYYLFGKYFWEGDYQQAFDALERNYQADPRDIWMLHETAYYASAHLNRPDIAVEKYQQLFSNYDFFRDKAWNTIYYHYTESLNRLGRHQEVIDLASTLPGDDWLTKADWLSWFELYKAFLETGQKEKAIRYVDTIVEHSRLSKQSDAAYGWSAFHQDSLPNPFHRQIRQKLEDYTAIEYAGSWILWSMNSNMGPFDLRVYQYYLLGDWEMAEDKIRAFRGKEYQFNKYPGDDWLTNANAGTFEVWIEAMLGFIYARRGKRQEALQQVEQLEAMRKDFPQKHSPSVKGFISYQQARIFSLLNEKDKAVQYLQQSLDEGRIIIWWNFILDWELSGLRGYEPYEALIRPKGE